MFNKEVYINRRKQLKEKLNNGIIILPGNQDSPINAPANAYHFRQDSSFSYFFGLDYQNLVGAIDVDGDLDYIFGNDVDLDDIIWMGPQQSIKDKAQKVGISETAPFNNVFQLVKDALAKGRTIHFLPPYRAENKLFIEKLVGIPVAELKDNVSLHLIKAVVEIRSIKEPGEIVELEKAVDIGYEMHTTAMKMAKPGMYEREISGAMEGIALSHGGLTSFPIICSVNGETLHNHYHGNIMPEGKMLLVDGGAETPMHYASDHTRTFPVNGKFTQKQKDIYNIVLKALEESMAATKPGVTYKSVHLIAARVIADGLKQLGLMKGNMEEAVEKGAHTMFFPHGLGHMIGLDVHDMEDIGENYVGYNEEVRRSEEFGTAFLRLGRKLEPGFVITNEPGIYFIPELIDKWKKENINHEFINFDKVDEYIDFGGIRLEDDILITENGCRNLGTKRIPITVEEVEAFMRG